MMLAELLQSGSLVNVEWLSGDRSRHRVYSVEPGQVVLSECGKRGPTDQPLVLSWGNQRGEHRVGVAGAERHPESREWWLRLDRDVHSTQRRNFARAGVALPVVVATDHGIARGRTVDIGEGGLCCILEQGPLPAIGDQVRVRIAGDGVDCLVPAMVVRVLSGQENPPAFAVRFLNPDSAATWLRRLVLRWQIAARQVAGQR